MRQIKEFFVNRCNIDISKFEGKPSKGEDYDQIIKQTCKVNLEGRPPVLYIADEGQILPELLPHLKELIYSPSQRFRLGKNNKSILFGAVPKGISRSHYCTFGSVAKKDSALHSLLTGKYSTLLYLFMKAIIPGWCKVWESKFKKARIHSDYQMAETIWTSGIINYNSAHNYHYDTMNVRKMMSSMITMKNNVHGGYLCFPEYRIAFEVKDCSMIFFQGSDILHGVTPINYGKDGYRYSIVYYTTQSLKECDSYKNELNNAIRK